MNKILAEIDGINFLDIGCSGSLPGKWRPLWQFINLIGFDPNKEECEKVVQKASNKYKSIQVFPYAIFDKEGTQNLYKTRSIYCYSLLPPDPEVVSHFYSYKEMFEVHETEAVPTRAFSTFEPIEDVAFDIVKIDSQGAEMPILNNAEKVLRDAFHVEIEVGFIQSYNVENEFFIKSNSEGISYHF